MTTVQLPGSELFDTHIGVHTETLTTGVSLALEFQKKCKMYNASRKHGI